MHTREKERKREHLGMHRRERALGCVYERERKRERKKERERERKKEREREKESAFGPA